jgi:hypothetical protein
MIHGCPNCAPGVPCERCSPKNAVVLRTSHTDQTPMSRDEATERVRGLYQTCYVKGQKLDAAALAVALAALAATSRERP